jgi:hypothetical protein
MAQGGGEEEDYFAHFEDLEFSEEDLVRIDCAYEQSRTIVPEPALPHPGTKGDATVTIEVERELGPASEDVLPAKPHPMSESPYDAFRRGKSLSVSDLTGPLWCVSSCGFIEYFMR